MIKTFIASFLGCCAALLVVIAVLSAVWQNNLVPGLVLMGIAAEKIIGPEESEHIVRTLLGREWRATDYPAMPKPLPGMPKDYTDPRFREPAAR